MSVGGTNLLRIRSSNAPVIIHQRLEAGERRRYESHSPGQR